jgi:hypothetical protein
LPGRQENNSFALPCDAESLLVHDARVPRMCFECMSTCPHVHAQPRRPVAVFWCLAKSSRLSIGAGAESFHVCSTCVPACRLVHIQPRRSVALPWCLAEGNGGPGNYCQAVPGTLKNLGQLEVLPVSQHGRSPGGCSHRTVSTSSGWVAVLLATMFSRSIVARVIWILSACVCVCVCE